MSFLLEKREMTPHTLNEMLKDLDEDEDRIKAIDDFKAEFADRLIVELSKVNISKMLNMAIKRTVYNE